MLWNPLALGIHNPQQVPTAKLALSSSTSGPCHLRSPCAQQFMLFFASFVPPKLSGQELPLPCPGPKHSGIRPVGFIRTQSLEWGLPRSSCNPQPFPVAILLWGWGAPQSTSTCSLHTPQSWGHSGAAQALRTPPGPWRWVGARFAPQAPKLGARAQSFPLPPPGIDARCTRP